MIEDVKNNPYLEVIRKAHKNNNLAFFVGSGFSSRHYKKKMMKPEYELNFIKIKIASRIV